MIKNESFVYSYDRCEGGFVNPLAKNMTTPDPCIVFNEKDGYYYGIHTADKSLTMYRSRTIRDMFCRSESKTVYEAKDEDGTYGYLWAPEIHIIDGIWYIYTSTHERTTKNFKHVICLRARGECPFEGFELAAHINPDLYAIDPTVYRDEKNGELYICFSAVLDKCQRLCIQRMKSPTEPVGDYSIISSPSYPWELVYPYDLATEPINEGAYFVKGGERLFIVYSANGCWSNDYAFGILELTGDDIMSPEAWEKSPVPFMTGGNGLFGPGHATFFYSPDKTELYMCYHCLDGDNPECVEIPRHAHVQRVLFDDTGAPHSPIPVPAGIPLREPKGYSLI